METAVALLWLGMLYILIEFSNKAEAEWTYILFRLTSFIHALGGLQLAHVSLTNGDVARVLSAYIFGYMILLFFIFALVVARYGGLMIRKLMNLVKW